jgi:hypothetical protein
MSTAITNQQASSVIARGTLLPVINQAINSAWIGRRNHFGPSARSGPRVV